MSLYINLRSHAVGGWLDSSQTVKVQDDPPPTAAGFNQAPIDNNVFTQRLRGKHVLFGTHGFNNNFMDGLSSLLSWSILLNLDEDNYEFVGVLWPGDSVFAMGLDYPEEPKVADDAGLRLADFLNQAASGAASVSFVSHSLGARLVLQTVNHLSLPVRRLILMAGAIDDNCLANEFAAAAAKVEKISVLASMHDEVLAVAFPMGNLPAGVIDQGHPWWHGALGRAGPAKPGCDNFIAPYELPDDWKYGHHHYLQSDPHWDGAPPEDSWDVPSVGTPRPYALDGKDKDGWQQAFSAAFTRTRFK